MTSEIAAFAADSTEEPGYLNFARVGPPSSAVIAEASAQFDQLGRARFGTVQQLDLHDERMRLALAALSGFRADQIVAQPNTTSGLTQIVYGLSGGILISPAEFPSSTVAVLRASQSIGALMPIWMGSDYGRVTPSSIREQLTSTTTAVLVSAVDYRTGFRADLEGIRDVIGDRLLIVDAIQGFGVADMPWQVADVVASGGQKWLRAGWGTGFLAVSDRAIDLVTPLLSGWIGVDGDLSDGVIPAPIRSAAAFAWTQPDRVALARLATAAEQHLAVGVPAIEARIADTIDTIIDLADEFALPITSSRNRSERAGIVVVTPEPDQLTVLTASLFNHGVSVTQNEGSVRISAHATTSSDTLAMLRGAFVSYGTAVGGI
jgi:selenocysteine lyase/cysteine desulfurase